MKPTPPKRLREAGSSALGPVAWVGRRSLRLMHAWRALLTTLFGALSSIFASGKAARAATRRITLAQVFFTGAQALPLLSVIALLIGATIIIQTHLLAPVVPNDLLGKILVAAVVRELAPLVTAIIVAGRSGTAIATEIGNMKANHEVQALCSLGIDPLRFLVLPRLTGVVISVLVLTVYFAIVAIAGGFALSLLSTSSSFSALQTGFEEALVPADLLLFLAKGTGLGAIVGWLCCHYGLQVEGSPTEVPQQASRAVVLSLLLCVAYNTAVTATFYAIVGPPAVG